MVHITMFDTATVHESLMLRERAPSARKPFREAFSGDDLRQSTNSWVTKKRVVDREHDWYEETVADPRTGERLHHSGEPLSQHRGHGSARHDV